MWLTYLASFATLDYRLRYFSLAFVWKNSILSSILPYLVSIRFFKENMQPYAGRAEANFLWGGMSGK